MDSAIVPSSFLRMCLTWILRFTSATATSVKRGFVSPSSTLLRSDRTSYLACRPPQMMGEARLPCTYRRGLRTPARASRNGSPSVGEVPARVCAVWKAPGPDRSRTRSCGVVFMLATMTASIAATASAVATAATSAVEPTGLASVIETVVPGIIASALPSAVTTTLPVTVTIVKVPALYELTAAFVGGLSGATRAAEKRMDVSGVAVLAVVNALGGGMLRDVLLQTHGIAAFENWRLLAVALAAAAVGFFFSSLSRRLERPFLYLDALSLGLFAIRRRRQGASCRTQCRTGGPSRHGNECRRRHDQRRALQREAARCSSRERFRRRRPRWAPRSTCCS